jgi:hypothetical protein
MPRMAAATTAARAPSTRIASTAPTAPTAACANPCHCGQLVQPPAMASAWRRASAPIVPTVDRTPPCNRRCRPLLAASRPARPRRPRQCLRPLRRWRHRPHRRHRGLRHRRRRCTPPRRPCTYANSTPLSKARWVNSLACSRWSSSRWLGSSHGWWGCLEHCVRARCEAGRKEHVGVGEEGRSRNVLDGESAWLSSSASTGWRAWNAKRCTPFQGLRAAAVHIATRVKSFPLPAMLG